MRELVDVDAGSLERFLIRWYGEPDRAPGASVAEERIPPPLRTWFELTSRWSTPVEPQNTVLEPERMWIEDGKRVFWVENQGVWLWAMELGGEDPAIYDRENRNGVPWRPTGVSLSTFLLHLAVFEAVMGSRYGAMACWVTPAQHDRILAPLRRLPMPDWNWPAAGHRLYAGEGLLAFAGPNFDSTETGRTATFREVWLAGHEPANLVYLAEIEGVDWDAPPPAVGGRLM